jgi:hypothetical protein
MDSSPFYVIDITFLNNLADAMPLRFKAVQFFSHEDNPADVESQMSFGSKNYFHAATSKDELASRLEAFGMMKSGLPQCLGGEWEYNKCVHWQELRNPHGVEGFARYRGKRERGGLEFRRYQTLFDSSSV